ncbi:MAG: MBL fold metallo-hydrolase [Kiritimatiellae bacterium]|jgi:phosphoribosyl 1,2-cyclic phosphodiesterase|nr:MBL fold metallo-hydrolase [Kiritimatiellia bacterium]
MRIVSLASGSGGNAYCVESCGDVLLIDCGVSCRELVKRCRATGIEPERIVAVAVTHDHSDHVRGMATFHSHFPDAALLANMMTADAVAAATGVPCDDFTLFENGQTFEVGRFTLSPFSVPHDTSDPVGYLVRAEGVAYFHATDVGSPLDSVGVKLAEADVATLESNHDPVMLRASGRPPSLKQRIAGPRGHLSNDQACDLVRRFASPRLRRLALAHLSGECNAPHIALGAMRETLREIGRVDVDVRILSQNEVVDA